MKQTSWAFAINPEPWAVGPAHVRHPKGRKAFVAFGKDGNQELFQGSLRECLEAEGITEVLPGPYFLEIWIWRQTTHFEKNNRGDGHRHKADGTNILKATEDALQGLVIDNDRNNVSGTWHIIEQSEDTQPMIVIQLTYQLSTQHRFVPSMQMINMSTETRKIAAECQKKYKEQDQVSISGNKLEFT